jgi:hypothetical protein
MKNVSDESCRENQNTHFMFFFRKSFRLRNNVKKYCTSGQDTDDNTTYEHCMLDIQVHKHPPRICNTAFPLQEWLQELAPLLRYTYTACPVKTY